MINGQDGTPVTSHTTNPVPLILIGAGNVRLKMRTFSRYSANFTTVIKFRKTTGDDWKQSNSRVEEKRKI